MGHNLQQVTSEAASAIAASASRSSRGSWRRERTGKHSAGAEVKHGAADSQSADSIRAVSVVLDLKI